jgi:hypothetical protein
MSYILVLIMLSNAQIAIEHEHFSSKEACITAGETFVADVKKSYAGWSGSDRAGFSCLPFQ